MITIMTEKTNQKQIFDESNLLIFFNWYKLSISLSHFFYLLFLFILLGEGKNLIILAEFLLLSEKKEIIKLFV